MEKIIRTAKECEIEAMKKLWIECFPKDVEYSEFFFSRIFNLSSARVCVIDDSVVAMLHSFPYDFVTPDGVLSGKYIYGVGTKTEFRSQGLAGELLANEAKDCDFTVIIPQSESLFDFYKKHGFCELLYIDKTVAKENPKALTRATASDIEKINEIYENSCRGFIHPLRTRERWETIMAEFEFLGGGIFLFDGGYCVAYKNGDRLEMSELCPLSGGSPFGYDSIALGVGGNVPIGAARLISERAKEIFGKAYGRYMNLMHN